MAYDSVEALMAALPELAKAAQAKLQTQDGLFALKLPDRQYFIRLQGGAVTVATVCSDTPDCTRSWPRRRRRSFRHRMGCLR